MQVRKLNHTVYHAQYHIAWTTRFRRKILNKGVASYFKIKCKEVLSYYPDWEFVEIGTDKDHVHLHMWFPPKYDGCKVVATIKKNTSRSLQQKFDFLSDVYWDDKGIWSSGFFFSTVGVDDDTIQQYVAMQGREDVAQAKLEL